MFTRCSTLLSNMTASGVDPGLLSIVPFVDSIALKDEITLDATAATLRKLDARDKLTKVLDRQARLSFPESVMSCAVLPSKSSHARVWDFVTVMNNRKVAMRSHVPEMALPVFSR